VTDSAGRVWLDREGVPIACVEKLRVLRENEAELAQMLRDVFEDAVLMGVGHDEMRRILHGLVEGLA